MLGQHARLNWHTLDIEASVVDLCILRTLQCDVVVVPDFQTVTRFFKGGEKPA